MGEGVDAINFGTLMERYKVGLITPKDFGSHFKLILHRAMLTNPHNPEAETSSCRLCGLTRESIWHWGECEGLKPIFETLRVFDGGQRWDDLKLNFVRHKRDERESPGRNFGAPFHGMEIHTHSNDSDVPEEASFR